MTRGASFREPIGHALFVERHGGDDGAGGLEGDVGAAIARAFDPGVIAGREQRCRDQRDAGLGRRHDQDLARLGLDPAMNRQMPEQRFLQRRMVDGPVPAQHGITRRAPQAAAPQIVWKFAFIRQSRLKRPRPPVVDQAASSTVAGRVPRATGSPGRPRRCRDDSLRRSSARPSATAGRRPADRVT